MFEQFSHKQKVQYIGLLLTIIGLYIFVFQIRWQLVFSLTGSQRFYIWAINFLAIGGWCLLAYCNLHELTKIDISVLLGLMLSCILMGYSKLAFGVSLGSVVVYITCCILPITLTLFHVNYEILEKALKILLIIINILFFLLAIGAFIDKLFDRAMIKWLASFMTANNTFSRFAYPAGEETARYFSFFGHPLLTAFVSNSFLVLNIACRKKKIPSALPDICSFLLAIFITACAASKTSLAVVLLIALIVYYNNIKMLIAGAVGFAVMVAGGIFNPLIQRLFSGGLTSGRVRDMKKLFSADEFPFHFFYGYGDTAVTDGSFFAAFELPSILTAFESGILFMVLFLVVPFIYITLKFLKMRQYQLYFLWITLFAQVNTYPTLAQGYDHPWFFYFVTFILLHIADNNTISTVSQKS